LAGSRQKPLSAGRFPLGTPAFAELRLGAPLIEIPNFKSQIPKFGLRKNTMKKVIIVHGWGGYPEKIWFPWLKNELEDLDFSVLTPQLPDPETPTIENWLHALNTVITNPDEKTFLVGHSLGCQTIIRYLEGLPGNIKIGGTVFVAGFFDRLTNMNDSENKIAEPWLKTPINFDLVKSHLKTSTAIFSDNDPFVPLDEQNNFRNKLGSKIVVKSSAGHFSEETKTTELPIVLEEILKISSK